MKTIEIVGYYDKEISYEQLNKLAFDSSTPDHLAEHYQDVLVKGKRMVEKRNIPWSRLIFLINPHTLKIRTWFD